jgi:branched-chain amino acid aminotransferase
MIAFLNGQFLPEEQAFISIFDRGFLYGDGLFETMRVYDGEPFQWTAHRERLQRGADLLRLHLPYDKKTLRHYAAELVRANRMPEAILRMQLTRGRGDRGYGIQGANEPSLTMTLHPVPTSSRQNQPRWRLTTATTRVASRDPLLAYKTCNRLTSILARVEAENLGAEEALLLNENDLVVETSSANIFWLADGIVCTPPLNTGALPGITRLVVLDLCQILHQQAREKTAPLEEIKRADSVFLTLSSWGIVEAAALDEVQFAESPLVALLRDAYEKRVGQEKSTALRQNAREKDRLA